MSRPKDMPAIEDADRVAAFVERRRALEEATDPDALFANDASEMARFLMALGPEVASAFHRPLDESELRELPPPLPPEWVPGGFRTTLVRSDNSPRRRSDFSATTELGAPLPS